ncbi:MINDY family deubiquitinase, partial [Pseudomonas aeruginosa]|uniref:MINDY family deubiquitinase n=1 Tax=Pseudomonas aeruginosa TaxID=287 RepID=UPI000EB3D8B9
VFKGFDVTETSRERLYENNEQNVETALSVLPSLVSGLDVNVKFIDSRAFEFTGNLCVFDALDVSLYHGWVVDARFDYTTGHVV